jgi:hypothetical protein
MKSRPPPARRPFQPPTRLGEDLSEGVMFAPARLLDPMRVVDGTRNGRYDCPDVAALDRHLDRLRRRVADLAGRSPGAADDCRVDIDRLLDRRSWLTLPVASAATPASAGR